jgi:hypothetical protein
VFTLFIAASIAAFPAPAKGLTVTGVVRDEAGTPIPKATVFIRTAAPRRGPGVL